MAGKTNSQPAGEIAATIMIAVAGMLLALIWLGLRVAAFGNETELFGNDHTLTGPLGLLGLAGPVIVGIASLGQMALRPRWRCRRLLLWALPTFLPWFALTYPGARV